MVFFHPLAETSRVAANPVPHTQERGAGGLCVPYGSGDVPGEPVVPGPRGRDTAVGDVKTPLVADPVVDRWWWPVDTAAREQDPADGRKTSGRKASVTPIGVRSAGRGTGTGTGGSSGTGGSTVNGTGGGTVSGTGGSSNGTAYPGGCPESANRGRHTSGGGRGWT